MLLFQLGQKIEGRLQPISHLSYVVPVPLEQPKLSKPEITLGSGYDFEQGFTASASAPLVLSKKNASLSFAPAYTLGRGRKPFDTGNLSLSSSLAVPEGRAGAEYGLLSGWKLSLADRHGIGLYYGRYCDSLLLSKPSLGLTAQYGPVGDSFEAARLFADARKGNLGFGSIFGLRAVAELGYSAVKSGIEAIWPKVTTDTPDEKTIAAVREGKADLFECLRVLAHQPSGEALRKLSGELLEGLLVKELDYSLRGKDSLLSLSDYDRIMPILEKNQEFLSSVGWAQVREGVDLLRMNVGGAETFKFVKNLSASGWAGNVAAGALNSFFSFEEMGFGKPLDLRWHGWNLPLTLADSVAGWFEGTLSFSHTSEGKGFFGKIFGFLEDVAGDVLGIAGRIIGTISPVYRKSDARADEARENVSSAISRNEGLLSGKELSPEERKAVYSNLLYLSRMLQALSQGSERRLSSRISQHLSSHELFYELLSCGMARAEAGRAMSDLESGKYGKESQMRLSVRERLQGSMGRLLQSYLFLSACGEGDAFEGQRKAEMEGIRALFESVGKKQDEEISAGTPLAVMDFALIENYRAVNWKYELSEASSLLGSLSDKSMDRHWQVLSSLFRKGPGEKISQEEGEAAERIFSLVRFEGKYPVLQGYISQWADGKGKAEELIPLVVGRLSESAGRGDYQETMLQLDWLTVLDRLFPAGASGQEGSPALKQALVRAFAKLDVSSDELEDDKQKLQFLSDLRLAAFLSSGLGKLAAARQAYGDEMEKWEKALRKSAKTLYELSQQPDKKICAEAQAAWQLLYYLHGESAFSGLKEKQADAVRSMLVAGAG